MTKGADAFGRGREEQGNGAPLPERALPRPDPALAALVADAIDGGLSREKLAELESRLADDPQARRYYLDAMLIHARLASTFTAANPQPIIDLLGAAGDGPACVLPPVGSPLPSSGNASGDTFGRVAAALVVAVLGVTAVGFGLWRVVIASLGIPHAAIAEISQCRYAIDGDSGEPLATGRRVGRQRLTLDSGVVEIGVRNGAVIVVEGPAEFEVASETLLLVAKGTAVVRLPPGVGRFVLETPTARVDAHDGECGVFVDHSLTTDVQAYSGVVAVAGGTKAGSGQFPQPVPAGTAIRFTSAAEETPAFLAFDERRFVRRLPPEPGHARPMENLEKPAEVLFGTPQIDRLAVTRAVRPVVVDGLLDEWNAEGVFRRARRGTVDDQEWLEGRMMYDDRNLYIAARVGDPAPMRNGVNPELDPRFVWRGGALQVFLSVDREMGWPADGAVAAYFSERRLLAGVADVQKAENPKLMTLVMWHHALSGRNRLSVIKRMTGEEMAMDPEGASGTFVRAADGKGYTLEYVIPWKALGAADDPPRSGDTLATAWELHLSDGSGRIWRDQIVEVRNPAEPRGIFLFERATTWGRAEYR
jgi:hypothetical protein